MTEIQAAHALQALNPDIEPGCAARVVRLAASERASPEQQAKAIAGLLDAGAAADAAAVAGALERRLAAGGLPGAAEQAAAAEELGAHSAALLMPGAPGYPAQLADAWPELGAPLWLFVRAPRGRLPDGPAVAIVGARQATLDGLRTARDLAGLLARRGAVVVSGMARGIDQAAHRGALDADGRTVAVLGTGFGVDYPAKDGALREVVAASGGLVTEHVPGVGPKPVHFLWRNRVISGLADITVVVEGRARSGALQTARLAAAQGREVLAAPGSINLATSQGPLALIRDGARTLTRLEDVLDALPAAPAGAEGATSVAGRLPPQLSDPTARAILGLLSAVPATPGRLAAASGAPVADVLAAIAALVDAGLAYSTPRGVARLGSP